MKMTKRDGIVRYIEAYVEWWERNRLKVWALAMLMVPLLAFVEVYADSPLISWLMGWSWLFPFWRP